MLRREAMSLSEVLADFFEEHQELKTKLAEHRAIEGWYSLLGSGAKKYTQKIYFRRGTLFVHLNSAVLRAELTMHKTNLIDKLNKQAGMSVVREIVLR